MASDSKHSPRAQLPDDDLDATDCIDINHAVVASIVGIAAREVPGVVDLAGGSFREDLKGFLAGKQNSGTGVEISENARGQFIITLRIIATYGMQLFQIAEEVQDAVRSQVRAMTNKDVIRVHVVVDGIRKAKDLPHDIEYQD